MKDFVPPTSRKKDQKSPHSWLYAADPGPVNPPNVKPFIQIYSSIRSHLNPEDKVNTYIVQTPGDLDGFQLDTELNKQFECGVYVKVTMRKHTHLLVVTKHPQRWDRIDKVTRKIVEAMLDASR